MLYHRVHRVLQNTISTYSSSVSSAFSVFKISLPIAARATLAYGVTIIS